MPTLSSIYAKIIKKARGSSIGNSRINKKAKIGSGSAFLNVGMDRYSSCGYDCTFLNCEIGSFCSIASRVVIGGMRHPTEFVSTSPVFLSHRDSIRHKFAAHDYLPVNMVKIGHDVWIGDGAFVKAGVKVGNGAVIGMGAVVTKDVPDYAIVAGNPARLIRMRFDSDMTAAMLAMQWWNWPEEKLRASGHLFNDPAALLKKEGFL